MIIEDGKGSGSKAEVRNHVVQVSTVCEPLRAALDGDAYVMHIDGITISAANYLIALVINEDGLLRDLIVTKVVITGNTTNDDAVLEINLGGTFGATIANSTAVVPGNVRSGSGKTAGGLFYVNDGDGDMTTETGAYIGYAAKQESKNVISELSVPGGWVLPHGQSISVSNTKDGKVFGCIHFYYRS